MIDEKKTDETGSASGEPQEEAVTADPGGAAAAHPEAAAPEVPTDRLTAAEALGSAATATAAITAAAVHSAQSTAQAAAKPLSQDRHSGERVRQLHRQWLFGLVLDDHVAE